MSPVFTPIPAPLSSGDTWSAANHNLYIRDSEQALYDLVTDVGMKKIVDMPVSLPTSEIVISYIPQGYQHLLLVGLARGSQAATSVELRMQFNGDTGTNYDWQEEQVNVSTTAASDGVAVAYIVLGEICAANAPANYAGVVWAIISGYSRNLLHKQVIAQSAHRTANLSAETFVTSSWGNWRGTPPINSIRLYPSAGDFNIGSEYSLYGYL